MSSSRDVQGHLQKVATGANTGRQKLAFDPTTGKLKVVDQANTGDNVVCTDMAAAGFFLRSLENTTLVLSLLRGNCGMQEER